METIRENIFNFKDSVDALVNPVNCVGTMGKGLAKQFKDIYPNNNYEYVKICNDSKLSVGESFIYLNGKSPKWIVNFPTKKHWRDPSKIEYITDGLDNLRGSIIDLDIH